MSLPDFIAGTAALSLSVLLMVRYFEVHRVLRPNVIMVMYVFHVVSMVLPAMVFTFDPAKPAAMDFYWATIVTAVAIPVGGLLGGLALPLRPDAVRTYVGIVLDDSDETASATRAFLFAWGVIAVVLLVLYIRSVPQYPLGRMLSGNLALDQLRALREAASPSTVGYVFGLSYRFVMPALAVAVVASWPFLRTRSGALQWMGAGLLIVTLINNSYATRKTPVAIIFVMVFTLWALNPHWPRAGRRRLPRLSREMRTAVLFAVVAIGMLGYPLLVFLYRPLGQDNPLWYVLVYGVFGRIFFRPALNAYYAFEIFPQHHPFTWFADVSTWAQLRGIEFINISTVVSGYRVDAQGAAPPPSIGTFYAELGWPGVVLGALFAAALFKAVENIFFNARRIDAIHLALYSVLVYGAFRFNWGYFHPIVKTECILPTLVALAAWNLWRRLDWSLPYPARGGAEAR